MLLFLLSLELMLIVPPSGQSSLFLAGVDQGLLGLVFISTVP